MSRLGDVINHWRRKTLNLEQVPLTEGPGLIDTLKIPFTYCWSPALVPKPPEWGPHVGTQTFSLLSFAQRKDHY